jgi:L-alanine-DL-glutamate epimerase-like enolase superfamily enzyme
MRIDRVQLYPLEVPMGTPIKMAGETLTHAQTLLVRITDEQGREGWGEASSAPLMTGETLGSIDASTQYLASRLAGTTVAGAADVRPRLDALLYGNPSAKSCVETALMDLLAQRAGVPLHQLLAGETHASCTRRIDMLHMLASGYAQKELEEARTLRRQGYRQWKIKVGAGDAAADLHRIRTLCEALGGDVVSADANQALSTDQAHALAAAGMAGGLAFLEQPFRTGCMDAMASLHATSGLALCADESIHAMEDISAHAGAQAAQGVSLKLIKLGGTQALVDAGRLCLSLGLHINLACKVAETTISAAATAHAGFALREVAWGFSMSNRYLAQDVCEQPLAPRDGAVGVDQLDRPGLGYAPDAERLREFASAALAPHAF